MSTRPLPRRALLGLLLSATLCSATAAPQAPPNLIELSPTLVSSGQPSAAWLATLATQGFDAVVYLAPSTVRDALAEEPRIVADQGLAFHHLPIPFDRPQQADLQAFMQLMDRLQGRKVLVHCQVNMRASTLSFLYRVLRLRQDPQQAWESVVRVWQPSGPWKTLVREALAAEGLNFDPF